MIAIIYFIVIVLANTLGAISGMGGGVIIKPVFDLIHQHSVAAISFYSTVAVFTMSIVSTTRQLKNGLSFKWATITGISLGSIVGGVLGNRVFEKLLQLLAQENVQLIQISLTILALLFSYSYSKQEFIKLELLSMPWYIICGLLLGFLSSLLGIGGGPINVSLLMLMFSIPIKEATVYSIGTIFFSQLGKLVTMSVTTGFSEYDLGLLGAIIPAAIIGGLLGARMSHLLSEDRVARVFRGVILLVIAINIYNMLQIIL